MLFGAVATIYCSVASARLRSIRRRHDGVPRGEFVGRRARHGWTWPIPPTGGTARHEIHSDEPLRDAHDRWPSRAWDSPPRIRRLHAFAGSSDPECAPSLGPRHDRGDPRRPRVIRGVRGDADGLHPPGEPGQRHGPAGKPAEARRRRPRRQAERDDRLRGRGRHAGRMPPSGWPAGWPRQLRLPRGAPARRPGGIGPPGRAVAGVGTVFVVVRACTRRSTNARPDIVSREMAVQILIHAAIWGAVGAAAGLALGIGAGARWKIASVVLGGLIGGAIGGGIYEVVAARWPGSRPSRSSRWRRPGAPPVARQPGRPADRDVRRRHGARLRAEAAEEAGRGNAGGRGMSQLPPDVGAIFLAEARRQLDGCLDKLRHCAGQLDDARSWSRPRRGAATRRSKTISPAPPRRGRPCPAVRLQPRRRPRPARPRVRVRRARANPGCRAARPARCRHRPRAEEVLDGLDPARSRPSAELSDVARRRRVDRPGRDRPIAAPPGGPHPGDHRHDPDPARPGVQDLRPGRLVSHRRRRHAICDDAWRASARERGRFPPAGPRTAIG